MIYLIVILILTVIDQVTKFLVLHSPGLGAQKEIIENIFYLNVIKNDGVAFGFLDNVQSLIIAVTAFLAGVFVTYILLKQRKERPLVLVPLSMITAGAFGNLIDRIHAGNVTDFIDIHFWPYIFNFADICVVLGCVVLLFAVLFPSIGSRRR